jgi:hypothetical protein
MIADLLEHFGRGHKGDISLQRPGHPIGKKQDLSGPVDGGVGPERGCRLENPHEEKGQVVVGLGRVSTSHVAPILRLADPARRGRDPGHVQHAVELGLSRPHEFDLSSQKIQFGLSGLATVDESADRPERRQSLPVGTITEAGGEHGAPEVAYDFLRSNHEQRFHDRKGGLCIPRAGSERLESQKGVQSEMPRRARAQQL